MNAVKSESVREPLILGNPTMGQITDKIAGIIEAPPTKKYWVLLAFTALLAAQGLASVAYTVLVGPGVWGVKNPIGWGWAITNFVWWVGIGHAGTLISAILFLFRQKWRTAINRSAEAMTIFAVICAGLFPLLHTGRQWIAVYWLLPYPNQMQMWTNFRSPLEWDVFAVSTYLTVSLVFWYTGLVPDFATMRNRVKGWGQKLFTFFSLGWTGSTKHWQHYEMAYLILAGLSTPLVLSVHSIVSFDFAVSVIPGWHTTIFPPYFVAGAIFSGFAMVVTLLVIARSVLNLQDFITLKHLDNMNKIILATGMMVGYAYSMEFFIAQFSEYSFEQFVFVNRATGPYAWAYWSMVSCNVLAPQIFWFKKMRRNIAVMFVVSIFVNIGMWFERFVIIATSLHRDFLPASWDYYTPSIVEVSIYVGTMGIFLTLFLLFAKFVPMLAIAEVKGVMPGAQPSHHGDDHSADNGAAHSGALHNGHA